MGAGIGRRVALANRQRKVDDTDLLPGQDKEDEKDSADHKKDIVLFDGIAERQQNGSRITLKYSHGIQALGAAFDEESKISSMSLKFCISQLVRFCGVSNISGHRQAVEDCIAVRLKHFQMAAIQGHPIAVRLHTPVTKWVPGFEHKTLEMGKTDKNGLARKILPVDSVTSDTCRLEPTGDFADHTNAEIKITNKSGWLVISDIDDTIKHTMTEEKYGALKTTFMDDPKPIEGMVQLYKRMQGCFGRPPVVYVSASPYNVYSFLHQFRVHYRFPIGAWRLRPTSWHNPIDFLHEIGTNCFDFKRAQILELHKTWPEKNVICVGDSTQADPEVYGDLARKTVKEGGVPWIHVIMIRRVRNVFVPGSKMTEKTRNLDKRFEDAFKDLPHGTQYILFDTADEAYQKLQDYQRHHMKATSILHPRVKFPGLRRKPGGREEREPLNAPHAVPATFAAPAA